LESTTSFQSSIIFTFSIRGITDFGLKHLSEGLKKLPLLKILNLDFEGFAKEVAINFLTFHFRCKGISNKGLRYLSEAFRKLNFLKELTLNFSRQSLFSWISLNHLDVRKSQTAA